MERAAAQHISGKANTIDDAGSRGHWGILRAYAAACGVRLTFVQTTADVDAFLAWALQVALEEDGGDDEDQAQSKRMKRKPRAAAPPSGGAAAAKGNPRIGASSASPRQDEAIVHMATISPRRGAPSPQRAPIRRHAESQGRGSAPLLQPAVSKPRLISPARRNSEARRSPDPNARVSPAHRRAAAPRGTPPRAASAPRRRPTPTPPRRGPRLLSPPAPSEPAVIRPASQPSRSPKPGEREDQARLRPRTAAAVRALASARAASRLINDDSEYAICPRDPTKLRSIVALSLIHI